MDPVQAEVKFELYRVSSRNPIDANAVHSGGEPYSIIKSQNQWNTEYDDNMVKENGTAVPGLYNLPIGWVNNRQVQELTFKDLPQNSVDPKTGRVTYYAYYVKEVPVAGYDSSVSLSLDVDGNYTFILNNRKTTQTTDLTVSKTWLNHDGGFDLLAEKTDADAVTMHLYRKEGSIDKGEAVINDDVMNPVDVSELKTVAFEAPSATSSTLVARSGDKVVVTLNDPSENLTATVKIHYSGGKYEDAQSVAGSKGVYVFTMADDIDSVTVSVTAGSISSADIANGSIRSLVYKLTQAEAASLDGAEYGEPLVLNASNDWTASIVDLPLSSKGKNYSYYFIEDKGADYSPKYEIGSDGVVHVTNYEPEMLQVNKKWFAADGETETTATKTDGEISYDIYQVANEPQFGEYSGTGNIGVDIEQLNNDGKWNHVKFSGLIGDAAKGKIRAGSKVKLYIQASHPSNQSLTGDIRVKNGDITNDKLDKLSVRIENWNTEVATRTIYIENVVDTIELSGTIETNVALNIEVSVMQEPNTSAGEPSAEDLTKTKVGTVTMGNDTVSFAPEEGFKEVKAYPGKGAWTSVIDKLPTTGAGGVTYTYHIEESEISGYKSSVDLNVAHVGNVVTISNVKDMPEELTGSTSFKVQKGFYNGSLDDSQFTFSLMQVKGEGSEEQADSNVVLPAPGLTATTDRDGQAAFDVIQFVKNGTLDQTGEFWFLIKEIVPEGVSEAANTKDGVTYDLSKHWVKVTVSEGGAELVVTKEASSPSGISADNSNVSNDQANGAEEDQPAADVGFTNKKVTTSSFSFEKKWTDVSGNADVWGDGSSIQVTLKRKIGDKSDEDYAFTYVVTNQSGELHVDAQGGAPTMSATIEKADDKTSYKFEIGGLESDGSVGDVSGSFEYYVVESTVAGYQEPSYENQGVKSEGVNDAAYNGGVIVNRPLGSYALPSTGGIGTAPFIVGGIALIALAAFLLLRGRRK